MVESRGCLDKVALENGVLLVDGWAAIAGSASILRFKLTCAGKNVDEYEIERDLPSPDVKLAQPNLSNSDCCRFRIRARLDCGKSHEDSGKSPDRGVLVLQLLECRPDDVRAEVTGTLDDAFLLEDVDAGNC